MAKKKIAARPVKLPPVENPELKKAIAALKDGSTPEKQAALFESLKNARLLSPCDFAVQVQKNAGGRVPQVRASDIRFYMLNTNDGKVFFPVYTDVEESGKFKIETRDGSVPKNVVRTIKEYDRILTAKDNKADGLVINPGSDNIVIPKQVVGVLSGRIKIEVRQQTPAPAPVQQVKPVYGEPATYPTRMVNAVYDHCATVPEVSRVWLKEKKVGPEASFILLVEMDKKDKAVLDGIKEVADQYVRETPVEIDYYDEKKEEEIVKGAVALYDRILEL